MQDEKDFLDKYDDLFNYHISDPKIEGVYETQIPLEFRVIIELGSIIKPKSKIIDKNESALNRTYELKELSPLTFENSRNPFEAAIPNIILYHSSSYKMHFFGVYIPEKSQFMIVTSCPKTPAKELVEIRQAYVNAQKEYDEDRRLDLRIFDFKNFKNLDKAAELINEYLNEYKIKNKFAFIVTVHSSLSIKRLASIGINILNGEVPTLKSYAMPEENNFPALDWAYYAVGYFWQKNIYLKDWFGEKYSLSTYSCIPLGNSFTDNESQIIDVLFSRTLQNSNYLLWYSDTKLPDLGGKQDCDAKRFLFDQFDSNIEISNKGFYRTYWVEIKISLLWINSIIQSDFIYQLPSHKIDKKINHQKTEEFIDLQNNLSEEVESLEQWYSSFLKIKAVVWQWIEDVKWGNMLADILLQNLYRWLSSPESKLYDPQLLAFVHFLMKKCFSELVQKFKNSDSVIIYGTFNKIIVETKKQNHEQAWNFFDFITKSLMKMDSFKYLQFEHSTTWEILLFKDRFNYAGYDKDAKQRKVICGWDLTNHLPLKVEEYFRLIIAELIHEVYEFNKKKRSELNTRVPINETLRAWKRPKTTQDKADAESYLNELISDPKLEHLDKIQILSESEDITFIKKLIKTKLSLRMFEMIEEIQRIKYENEREYNLLLRERETYLDQE